VAQLPATPLCTAVQVTPFGVHTIVVGAAIVTLVKWQVLPSPAGSPDLTVGPPLRCRERPSAITAFRRAFTELGVSRIVATTMAVNTASRRVLEKAGLTCTRTVHLDWPEPLPGNEHGDVEYQLDRSAWAAR
jgi:GNAT acetyltransferase-like protein